jgi:N-acylneuraminate cytidylyltransferase
VKDMGRKTVAIIPVREGSKRVEDKNFKPFLEYENLLTLKIKQLKTQKNIDKIYVSSNSVLAKSIAEKEGVGYLERDPYMCSQEAKLYEYNTHMIETVPEDDVNILWSMVTAPLMYDYDAAIEKFNQMEKKGYDSLVSVIKYNDFLVNKHGKPYNCTFGHWHLLTQELEELYQLTGGVYIASKKNQLDWKYWIGIKPYLYEVSKIESVDIDDNEDFEIAEIYFKHLGLKFE